ncbi:MBL fold metallo-hydrolase [Halomonas sp. 18H]|nr:MBL fold metallo-hydrolase [Halomonas sp. 18H]MCW4153867.1 MBL fold metallo-hydrolase [Halomonas sp. 18H]
MPYAFLAISVSLLSALAIADEAATHAERGLSAATQWPGYASLCDLDSHMRNVNVARKTSDRHHTAEREHRNEASRQEGNAAPLPPMKVFENLYFLGNRSVSAWLYGNEDGYLLIDGLNTDEEAQEDILGGMETLGLSPSAIKAVLVTHGHGDHYGGADYIAKQLDVDIMMTQPDWELVETLGEHPRFGPPPKRGATVSDGETLHFGNSSLNVHITPGHTPGTISPIFTVYDHGKPHAVMLWGGTGFNFGPDIETFETYADSAAKMRRLSGEAGVDVFISNHAKRDGTIEMMQALSQRHPEEPHPFVRGSEGDDLFTVLEQCALAQAERFRMNASK